MQIFIPHLHVPLQLDVPPQWLVPAPSLLVDVRMSADLYVGEWEKDLSEALVVCYFSSVQEERREFPQSLPPGCENDVKI